MTAKPSLTEHNFRRAVLLALLLGLGVRLALIVASGWRIDYDEAMIGLLGMRVQGGSFSAFVPGQPTLGSIEAYLLAPLFALFGANVYSFRLLSLLLSAAYIVTTAWVGRAALGTRGGAFAALLAALCPPYMLIGSLKTWGATIETLILGNLLLLLVSRALADGVQRRPRWQVWFAAGVVAGVMFWIAWLGFYYFIPAALLTVVVLLSRRRGEGWRQVRPLLAAVPAFLLGSAPFWLHNLRHDFETFRVIGAGSTTAGEINAVLRHFASDLLPRLVTGAPEWGAYGRLAHVLALLLYGAGMLALAVLALRRASPAGKRLLRVLLLGLALTIPPVYALSSYGDSALNPWGIDATGRYVLMLHSVLPVGAAALAGVLPLRAHCRGARWTCWHVVRGAGGASAVALLLTLNISLVLRINSLRAFDSPYYHRLPNNLTPLVDYLNDYGYNYVWTDTGIAQVLVFQTGGQLIAADYYDAYIAGGILRFPELLTAVETAAFAVYVVPVQPGQTDFPLRRAFAAAGIGYRLDYPTASLAVIVPERRVNPHEVAAGLGYQY